MDQPDSAVRPRDNWSPLPWCFGVVWCSMVLPLAFGSFAIQDQVRRSCEELGQRTPLWVTVAPYVVSIIAFGVGNLVLAVGLKPSRAVICEPTPGACGPSPFATDDEWRELLRNHDLVCPDCRYSLYDGLGYRCPECGTILSYGRLLAVATRKEHAERFLREASAHPPGEFRFPGVCRSLPRPLVPTWARRSAFAVSAILMWPFTTVAPFWLLSGLTLSDSYADLAAIVLCLASIAVAWYSIVLLSRAPAWSARNPKVRAFVEWLARPLLLMALFLALAAAAAVAVFLNK